MISFTHGGRDYRLDQDRDGGVSLVWVRDDDEIVVATGCSDDLVAIIGLLAAGRLRHAPLYPRLHCPS